MKTLYPHLVAADTTDLPGQFVLGAGHVDAPRAWNVATLGAWTLAAHPSLHRVRLLAGRGEHVGWLLGHAVTAAGDLAAGTLTLPAELPWDDACEQLAGELAGRFLLLLLAGPTPRLYTDALGMLAAVYAPALELAASTTRLIPLGPETPYNVPRILAVGAPYGNGMYPLGLTPRDGIERVLPNHYLDLRTWQLVRRWPAGDLTHDADPIAVQARVLTLASRTIRGLAHAFPLQSPLTAGRDSRLLLACARDLTDRMTFFTAHLPGELVGWRDVRIARAIAARFGLRHRVLPHRRANTAALRTWVARTGGEAGEVRGWHGIRTFQQVDRDRLMLNGWAGDVARPIFWKQVAADATITAADVLNACEVPHLPEFVQRANRWLRALPTRHAITTMDLLMIEQRGGCWAGVIEQALDGEPLGHVAPLCQQEIVRMLMAMPEDYRRRMTFERDLITRAWPELAAMPFNEQVPVPDLQRRYFHARAWARQLPSRLRAAGRKTAGEPAWLLRKMMRLGWLQGAWWALQTDASWLLDVVSPGIVA